MEENIRYPALIRFLPALFIIVCVMLVYSNSLQNQFVWDDEFLIQHNPAVKDYSNILKLFTQDTGKNAGVEFHSYRPLQFLTYSIDYQIWGLNVLGYHLTNVLLQSAVALCVWQLLQALFQIPFVSFLTALLFAIHPVHTQAITYVSGRADPLAALGMLLAFLAYVRMERTGKRLFLYLSLAAYSAALFSRENSIIFLALILLYHNTFQKNISKKRILPFILVTGGYVFLRLVVLRHLLPSEHIAVYRLLPGFLVALSHYAQLLVFPTQLHIEYGKRLFSLTDPRALIGAGILISGLIFAVRKKKHDPLIFFGIAWFFICLLPQSNLLFPLNAYMAEHWLYLPSIGVFLLFSRFFVWMFSKKYVLLANVLIIILVAWFFVLTFRQNSYWKTPEVFYERNLMLAPQSALLHNNLGREYVKKGNLQEALALFKKAITLDPSSISAYNNLGSTYYYLGKTDEAIMTLKQAISVRPDYPLPYYNLSQIYFFLAQYPEALAYADKAVRLDFQVPREYLIRLNRMREGKE